MLKAQRQISKKRFFNFIGHILSYFRKLSIDGKYVNKRGQLLLHQMVLASTFIA